MFNIYTDEQGRDYYVDGKLVTKPIIVRDWRFLWLKKRHTKQAIGYKPIRVYINDDNMNERT